ncbi:hypothetical protein GUJ93_ZPchr0012g20862 [Zizania palustris]|nr:hypothetical protein GUJ93_ZPchr0012g20862 [Zizania palustris]
MVLGLGFYQSRPNIGQALKRHDVESEWLMCPAIPVDDIMVSPLPLVALLVLVPVSEKKKSKKKVEKSLERENGIAVGQFKFDDEGTLGFSHVGTEIFALKAPKAKLADVDLFLDNTTSGVIREGSLLKMRHKHKQCIPLLSNKTRYQSPKGRFVSEASLLQQT